MNPDRIIITSSQPTFIPIIKRLARQGFKFVTLEPQFARTLADLDLPAAPLSDAINGLHDTAIKEAINILNAAQEPTRFNGVAPGVAKFMNDGLPVYLYSKVSDLALMVLALDRVQPDLMMLHNDVEPLTRCAALWAKQNKVPCLHIPHAIYQDVNRGPAGTDVHDLITASHLAAAGEFQREWYIRRGFSVENIRLTGLPQFDEWFRYKPDRDEARRKIGLDLARPVVVYASTWPQGTNLLGITDEWAAAYLSFLEAVKTMPQVQPIIKLHPRGGQDNFAWHGDKAKELDVDCRLTAMHNNFVLAAADLVIAYGGSNFLLEAACVPGVRLMTTHGYDNDEAIGKVAISPAAFQDAIKTSLSYEPLSTTQLVYKYLGIPDGNAAERIAMYAQELADAVYQAKS